MGIEIEKKFTVEKLPENLGDYPCHEIEQAYLNVSPAIRVRKQDEDYYMTYKGKKTPDPSGNIGQTEYNLLLDKESYEHMRSKADGNIITKKRYLVPLNKDAFSQDFLNANPDLDPGSLKIELDVFEGVFEGRILAEVEFPTEEAAKAYKSADWFEKEVTGDIKYSNAHMSTENL